MISENVNHSRKKLIDSIIDKYDEVDEVDDESGSESENTFDIESESDMNEYENMHYEDFVNTNIIVTPKESDMIKQYSYLEDNVLSKVFGEFSESTNSEKTLYLCPYVLNSECESPFIKYVLNSESSQMTFPNSRFQCPVFPDIMPDHPNDDSDNETDSQSHTYFMNACTTSLLSIFPVYNIINSELISNMYRGFIEVNDDAIFVLFDCTPLIKLHNMVDLPGKMTWMILDDILFNVDIQKDHTVDPAIVAFFDQNPILKNMRLKNEDNITNPRGLYPCTQDDSGEFANIINTNKTDSVVLLGSSMCSLPFFGDAFVFSATPLAISPILAPNEKMTKCAVFMKNSKYLVKNAVENFDEDEIVEFINRIQDLDVLSLYFYYKGNQYWAIKSPIHFTQI